MPAAVPPKRQTIDGLLVRARSRLHRVSASELATEVANGALVVDTRPVEQRQRDGGLPGAVVIDRNVLEWRLDPTSPECIPEVAGHNQRIVVVCNEGFSSSLTAESLQHLGFTRATDLIGGYQEWLAFQNDGSNDEVVTRQQHWDSSYEANGETGVSWFQSEPAQSLALIGALGITPEASVIDIGGGASRLVDALLDRGFDDVTVMDISRAALGAAQQRLGERAERVRWLAQDLLTWTPERSYDVWHDRAVLHFLVDPADRSRYVRVLRSSVRGGGHVVIATFAPDGPEQCSGLVTARYDADQIAAVLGANFDLVDTRREAHRTPGDVVQPFTWATFVRRR